MAHCIKCSLEINKNEQYYTVSDMGPELYSIVEQNLAHQVDIDGAICSQCFDIIEQGMSAVNSSVNGKYKLQLYHDSIVCVMCGRSLFKRRAHTLPEGAERQYIAENIAPREVTGGSLICSSCWTHTQRILQQQGIVTTPAAGIVCVCCNRSLTRIRRHTIPEGSERNLIAQKIYPREIPPRGLVCYPCWESARRRILRSSNIDKSRQNNQINFLGRQLYYVKK